MENFFGQLLGAILLSIILSPFFVWAGYDRVKGDATEISQCYGHSDEGRKWIVFNCNDKHVYGFLELEEEKDRIKALKGVKK